MATGMFLWLTWVDEAQTPGLAAPCAGPSQPHRAHLPGPAETQPASSSRLSLFLFFKLAIEVLHGG